MDLLRLDLRLVILWYHFLERRRPAMPTFPKVAATFAAAPLFATTDMFRLSLPVYKRDFRPQEAQAKHVS